MRGCWLIAVLLAWCLGSMLARGNEPVENADTARLRAAILHLMATYGDQYPRGNSYLERLAEIEQTAGLAEGKLNARFRALQREALLANPLLAELPGVLLVKRRPKTPQQIRNSTTRDSWVGLNGAAGREIGLPSNHECNASLERDGYDNEICLLSPVSPEGQLRTVYRPPQGRYVGELDLHFDARRMLVTQSAETNWQLWEVAMDGTASRPVSQLPPDVDAMDGCYLPNGKILFGSTASYQSVPCWHGCRRVSNLYVMDGDGSHVRQLCFDQDHNFHPVVLPSGQVLYHRWDYTGICHIFLRQLMTMNPDGTRQRALYGSNSWYPNALFFPQPIPDQQNQLLCVLSGYHGPHRMGQLVIVDPSRGWEESKGIVQRLSGRGDPIAPLVRDDLVGGDWPKFLHPFPLSDTHFLVSACLGPKQPWSIYLVDRFDNLVLLCECPGYALLEPTPVAPRLVPPVIPDQTDLARSDATVYINDVYSGPGLAGVPRGTIKRLRILGYHFGYRGLAGSDKVGYGGPWDVMRIVGTTSVAPDGSASFRVPANTPLAIQTLDENGMAVQLMRSWFTAMPGEQVSCVGCHESPKEVGHLSLSPTDLAPRELEPWYGPARGFDFEREVQPVLDRHCISCHNGSDRKVADLRSEREGGRADPKPIGYVPRLHPEMLAATGGKLRYSPAYDVLVHYIRRVGVEDDVSLLVPGEYHASTSELVQMLQQGHYGVQLDAESWDRLTTWIDLNGPCHGTWNDVFPIPDGAQQRRQELRQLYGGPRDDPEEIPTAACFSPPPVLAAEIHRPQAPAELKLADWPWSPHEAQRRQQALGNIHLTLELGDGIVMDFVKIPSGTFIAGDANESGATQQRVARVETHYWIGRCEVTNAQFRRFDPSHTSGYYVKRRDRADGKGLTLDDPRQPVVRISAQQAMHFCRWLSTQCGVSASLPTEQQWEFACRAGSARPLSYGTADEDFSAWGNMADRSFSTGVMHDTGANMPVGGATQVTGGVPHLLLEGAALADRRYDDTFRVTATVGSFQANRWGLCDMHGNAAEWARSAEPGSNTIVARGGSFFDRPARCTSSVTVPYAAWQRVFNVGFRVVLAAD